MQSNFCVHRHRLGPRTRKEILSRPPAGAGQASAAAALARCDDNSPMTHAGGKGGRKQTLIQCEGLEAVAVVGLGWLCRPSRLVEHNFLKKVDSISMKPMHSQESRGQPSRQIGTQTGGCSFQALLARSSKYGIPAANFTRLTRKHSRASTHARFTSRTKGFKGMCRRPNRPPTSDEGYLLSTRRRGPFGSVCRYTEAHAHPNARRRAWPNFAFDGKEPCLATRANC